MPDPRQGKRGHLAEELVERACLYYRSQGLALITKAPTPVTVLSGGRAFFKAKAISDFVGVLAGGIPVSLEVKSSRNLTRFRLDEEVIIPHQVAYLNDTIALGGIGAYLFLWRQGKGQDQFPRCGLASLDRVEQWLAEGVASIEFTRLLVETWECPFSGGLQAFDFLPGLILLAQGPRQERPMSTALPLVGSRQGART